MPSLSFLFCQCAIVLVLLDGVVCPFFDFVMKNFSTADIYHDVVFEGPLSTGHLVLKKRLVSRRKTDAAEISRQKVIPLSDILKFTITQEGSNPKVVSFNIRGKPYANYNIRFTSEGQARHFVEFKSMPACHKITWARIYSNFRPIVMAYDHLDNGDLGFKYLDNGNYPNPTERLSQMPYIFRRTEIQNAVRIMPEQILYLRNITRSKDYELMFYSKDDLNTFLRLFPKCFHSEERTRGYYTMSRA